MKKCKGCKWYTGVQCHGHGDFWGNCQLFEMFLKTETDVYVNGFADVCLDDTNCVFEKAHWIKSNSK